MTNNNAMTESARRLASAKVQDMQSAYQETMAEGVTDLLVTSVQDHNPEILGRLAAQHQLEGARRMAIGSFWRFIALSIPCCGTAAALGLGAAIVVAVGVGSVLMAIGLTVISI